MIRPEHGYHALEIMLAAQAAGADGRARDITSPFPAPDYASLPAGADDHRRVHDPSLEAAVTTYSPSPRPTFDGPAAIPYASVTRHVWGDAEAGEVADWIYASTDKIHCLVFGLPVNGAFRTRASS